MPDYKRDVQFTVNGQFQPVVKSKAGQTEIWVLANVSDVVYTPVQLTETATGNHQKIAIVGQDGVPYPKVHHPIFENGTKLLIPPATRYAIAVTMPDEGDLILEMPPRGGGASTISAPGVLYTNDGTENPPAVLGSVSVLPQAVSYYDGFFVSPTQVLARATTSGGKGVTTEFKEGQKLDAYTVFEDISKVTPDVERELTISGGFVNNLASTSDAKSFTYVFEGIEFPYVPLLQPRLGSIEEWKFLNNNNDEHPIHIHVNDFQVTYYLDPTRGLRQGLRCGRSTTPTCRLPSLAPKSRSSSRARSNLRMKFDDFTGLFVMHCHRLNHEDNGLMMMVNVIPAMSTYAVAVPGSKGKAAQVKIYDGSGDKLLATVTPFAGFEGTPSVAMGDVNDDGVYDLVVGAGKDHAPEVVAYSGQGRRRQICVRDRACPLRGVQLGRARRRQRGGFADRRIDRRQHHRRVWRGRAERSQSVPLRSAVAVRQGPVPVLVLRPLSRRQLRRERRFRLRRFRHRPLQHRHRARRRQRGAGEGVRLPADAADRAEDQNRECQERKLPRAQARPPTCVPRMQASRIWRQPSCRSGSTIKAVVSLATGWLGGTLGGAERIVVGQLAGPGQVKVFSSGSALQGGPAMYLAPADHSPIVGFGEMASFTPFDGGAGVTVATTSTTHGANLLVSGVSAKDKAAQVRKYELVRPSPQATNMLVKQTRHSGLGGGLAAECAWRRLRPSRLRLVA